MYGRWGEDVDNKKNDQPILITMIRTMTMVVMMMMEPLPRGRGRKPISDVSSPPIRSKILLLIILVVLTKSLSLVLRILPQQSTAFLSHVRPSMYSRSVCHRRNITTFCDNLIGPPVWSVCFKKVVWSDNLQRNLYFCKKIVKNNNLKTKLTRTTTSKFAQN